MSGHLQPGPTLMPGEPRYEQLAEALAGDDQAKLARIIHPFARMLPMVPDNQRTSLRASLAERQLHAVIFANGLLLDGRNRTRELTQLRKPISTAVFIGDNLQALALVKAENIERRHLSPTQLADYAARIAMLPVGANQHTTKPAQNCAPSLQFGSEQVAEPPPQTMISQVEAAEMFNVSRRSVQSATVVVNQGTPELQKAVQEDKIAISAAEKIARLPIEEQRAIIAAADPKVVKEVSKKNRADKQAAGRERRLANMAKPDATPLLSGGDKAAVLWVDVPREFVSWSEATGAEKSPENHYRTEDFDFLASLRDQILERTKPDCVLFMHAWANSLLDQIDLMAEWGFARMRRRDEQGRLLRGGDGRILPAVGEGRYRTHQVWAKRSANGNYHRGTGFWFIDCHELLLVGARGDVPAPLMGTQSMSILDALVREHSRKPDEIRDQIDRYFPGVPKLELFGRIDDPAAFKARYPDWQVWGNHALQAPAVTREAAA